MNQHPAYSFHIPTYPHLGRLSDPCHAFGDEREKLQALAARAPQELSADELCFIFNAWWPGGSFEELAAYLPHALELLQAEPQEPWADELSYLLPVWCHAEAAHLRRDPALFRGLEDAFMQLFRRWTSGLAWRWGAEEGRVVVIAADHLENLLARLRWEGASAAGLLSDIPWLQAGHYLPLLHSLDSPQRAIWALWASDEGQDILPPSLRLTDEQRHRALAIATRWLRCEAGAEEAAIGRWLISEHM